MTKTNLEKRITRIEKRITKTMQLFYTNNIEGNLAHLSVEEARHVVQVLRKKAGDAIDFVDGKGAFYKGEIIETGKKTCLINILEKREVPIDRPRLQIAIAPTKNIDRLEWFLEKATEIGIDEVIPVLCERSERKRIRQDRLEKIMLSAMKQSLKATLPKLRELTNLKSFIEEEHAIAQKFIAYCNDDELEHLQTLGNSGQSGLILIGPEGDFSPEEIARSKKHGFQGVSLGQSRLRTETAGVVACTIFNMLCQK